jgi:hypothetical protein
MNVKDFIKVTTIADSHIHVVPARNKAHYEQANDVEVKAKKSEIYKIEEPTEQEVLEYYPELTKEAKPVKGKGISEADVAKKVDEVTQKVEAEANKVIEDKDKEIAALKEQLAANAKADEKK